MNKRVTALLLVVFILSIACTCLSFSPGGQQDEDAPFQEEDSPAIGQGSSSGGQSGAPGSGQAGSSSTVQVETANNDGVVSFTEPGSNETVNITVVDTGGKPVKKAQVIYEHGEEFPYEVFFVLDRNDQLIAVDFFLHNSDHEIVVEPGVLQRANPDKEQAILGYVRGQFREQWKDFYKDTIPCEKYMNGEANSRIILGWGEEIGKHVVIHIVANLLIPGAGEIAAIYYTVANANEIQDDIGHFYAEADAIRNSCAGQQWDWYHSQRGGNTDTWVTIQSQPPVMQSANIEQLDDGRFNLSWSAADPTHYSGDIDGKVDTIDHTIFLGKTDFSDLKYHYRIVDENDAVLVDWQETTQASAELSGAPGPGENFILEVYATDEVENRSETLQAGALVEAAYNYKITFQGTQYGAENNTCIRDKDYDVLILQPESDQNCVLGSWIDLEGNSGVEVAVFKDLYQQGSLDEIVNNMLEQNREEIAGEEDSSLEIIEISSLENSGYPAIWLISEYKNSDYNDQIYIVEIWVMQEKTIWSAGGLCFIDLDYDDLVTYQACQQEIQESIRSFEILD